MVLKDVDLTKTTAGDLLELAKKSVYTRYSGLVCGSMQAANLHHASFRYPDSVCLQTFSEC